MTYEAQANLPPKRAGRGIFLSGMTLAAVVIIALLGYLFFIRYTDLAGSGDANLPIWIGNSWGNIAYFLISLVLIGFYVGIAVEGTSRGQAWHIGMLLGVPLGLLSLLLGVILNLFQPTDPLGSIPQTAILLAGLVACVVAGIWGAWQGGRIISGIVAAFWCAFFQILLIALSTILQDALFASTLASTVWNHDLTTVCQYRHGLSYESCEVGDNLGAIANLLLTWPIIGALLGMVPATLTGLFRRARGEGNELSSWRGEGRFPLIFALAGFVLFLVEVIGKIW